MTEFCFACNVVAHFWSKWMLIALSLGWSCLYFGVIFRVLLIWTSTRNINGEKQNKWIGPFHICVRYCYLNDRERERDAPSNNSKLIKLKGFLYALYVNPASPPKNGGVGGKVSLIIASVDSGQLISCNFSFLGQGSGLHSHTMHHPPPMPQIHVVSLFLTPAPHCLLSVSGTAGLEGMIQSWVAVISP